MQNVQHTKFAIFFSTYTQCVWESIARVEKRKKKNIFFFLLLLHTVQFQSVEVVVFNTTLGAFSSIIHILCVYFDFNITHNWCVIHIDEERRRERIIRWVSIWPKTEQMRNRDGILFDSRDTHTCEWISRPQTEREKDNEKSTEKLYYIWWFFSLWANDMKIISYIVYLFALARSHCTVVVSRSCFASSFSIWIIFFFCTSFFYIFVICCYSLCVSFEVWEYFDRGPILCVQLLLNTYLVSFHRFILFLSVIYMWCIYIYVYICWCHWHSKFPVCMTIDVLHRRLNGWMLFVSLFILFDFLF